MKIILSVLALLPASLLALGPGEMPADLKTLAIGDPAPDFTLPGIDGKTYTLEDFAEPEVLMVYFTGTHCPTSNGMEPRLRMDLAELKDASFAIVAINPNHSSGLRPDEFGHTLYDETFADSKRYAEDLGWDFPYLYDGEKQLTARAYGCLATPHVFIFDQDRKLRYKGRYDDSRFADPATVKSEDARNAVDALLAGKPVPVEVTRPHGCSTKWRERGEHVQEDEERWQNTPVTIEKIDADGVARLRKNGTGKLRLFNVWSTTCAPCVQEMPDLTRIARKFSRRDFELITISLDLPADKAKAEAFLGKHRAVMSTKLRKSVLAEGRTTNNYLYTGASTDDLARALDEQWPGPQPHTVLVDQKGEIIYRHNGIIDPAALTKVILDTLKPYYEVKGKR